MDGRGLLCWAYTNDMLSGSQRRYGRGNDDETSYPRQILGITGADSAVMRARAAKDVESQQNRFLIRCDLNAYQEWCFREHDKVATCY